MGLPGACRNVLPVLLISVILVTSGPTGALVPEGGGDPLGAASALDTGLPPEFDPGSLPGGGLLADEEALNEWLAWSAEAPLELVEHDARENAPESGRHILPSPDAHAGHARADAETKRDAWRSWRVATEVMAMRVPDAPLGTPLSGNAEEQAEPGDNQTGSGEAPAGSPVGQPHSLDGLWRLQTHGSPRILLPAGAGDETYLVTERGVLFLPEKGADPDWMLHLEGVAGHARVTDQDGRKDLVVGMHDIYSDSMVPSIWVIDGEGEKVRFSGLHGERALLFWDLTDVDGDGTDDILGIDKSGNITAIELDGTEIYREPVPKPDLPEESGDDLPDPLGLFDEFVAIGLARTGGEVLGDGNGDGVLDVFTTSWWGLLGAPQVIAVSLIDGKNGDVLWTEPVEPNPDPAQIRLTMPMLTGDLDGDGNDDVHVFDSGYGFFGYSAKNLYLSGEDGSLLARDGEEQFRMCCDPMTGEYLTSGPYIPLAFVDLNGDGTHQIIGIDLLWVDYWNDEWIVEVQLNLQERILPPVPGGPTLLEATHQLDQEAWWVLLHQLEYSVNTRDGKDEFMLLVPDYLTPASDGTQIYTIDENGGETLEPPQPIGQYSVNPQTGQGYAWTLRDDRWRPVNEELSPTGNGTQLIMSAHPIAFDDRDDDGTPDFLVSRSLGYFWVSGRNGGILDRIERSQEIQYVASSETDDRYILERDDDHYLLFDTHEGTTAWNVNRDVRGDAGSVHALADFSGDGENEILFRYYDLGDGWSYDERWKVYSGALPGKIWDVSTDYASAYTNDIMPKRNGTEVLIIDEEYDGGTQVDLHAPDDEASGSVWGGSYGYIDLVAVGPGYVALLEDGSEGLQVLALNGEDGTTAYSQEIAYEQDMKWLRIVTNEAGRGYLVYSFTTDNENEEHAEHQHVSVVDLKEGEEITTFQISDPIVQVTYYEYLGGSYPEVRVLANRAGPSLGDWNGDKIPELALTERNWPVVRSLKDGEIVAVGPTYGAFTFTTDLNGDGRQEVALDTGGSVRMYAYDASGSRLDAEDPLARIQNNDTGETDNQTLDRFFDGDKKKSPGPGVLVVLLLTALGALTARNRARRND